MSRYARRVDRNQPEIVQTLRACGWFWFALSNAGRGAPDGIATKAGRLRLVEIKDGERKPSEQRLTKAEADVHAAFKASGVPIVILRSVDDALALR